MQRYEFLSDFHAWLMIINTKTFAGYFFINMLTKLCSFYSYTIVRVYIYMVN